MAGEFVIGNMVAKLAADTGDFIKDMKGAGDAAKKFQKDAGAVEAGGKKISGAFSGMGSAIGGFLMGGALVTAGYALVNFMKSSVTEAEDAARAQAQLAAVIESTGGAAGVTASEINDMATDLSELTGVEDDLIVKNSALLLTFTKVGEEVFPEAMEAALNMSAVMGQDLQSSIVQVGKALNEPVEGIGALRRVGVQLTDDQEDLVKSLMETGRIAEAQGIILDELAKEFGGAAEAMHEAGTGSDTLKNSIGNLKEEIGRGLIPATRDANSLLNEYVESLTFGVSAENALVEAAQRGIITQREANDMTNKFTWTSMTAADAMEWLQERVDTYNTTQEAATSALNNGQSALSGWTGKVKDSAAATEDVVEANKAAEQTTKDWMAELDTGIDNTIANWLERLDFMQAGGGEIQAAGEAVKAALLEGKITPDEAAAYWNELFVVAEQIKVEMGEITAKEAAQNIADTLGMSLKDAIKLIEEVKRKGKFNITSTITVKVNYVKSGKEVGGHPDFAEGGDIQANQVSMVGEEGPELLVTPKAGTIIPNDQVQSYLGSGGGLEGGGGDVYQEITINNYNEMAAALNAAILLNGRSQRLNAGM